jgi:hypothetical protein
MVKKKTGDPDRKKNVMGWQKLTFQQYVTPRIIFFMFPLLVGIIYKVEWGTFMFCIFLFIYLISIETTVNKALGWWR